MADLQSKSLVTRIYDAFNERDAYALDDLLSPDFVDRTPGPAQKPGVDGIKEVWAWIWSKHPGVRIRVDEIIAEGDKVATRVTLLAPSGQSESEVGWLIEMIQLTHGRVVALWNMIQWSAKEK